MYEPELPDMHDAAWRRADIEARDKLKMAADESPWMDLKPSLYGVPKHERYPKLLDVSYKDFLKKEIKGNPKAQRRPDGRPVWYVDLSQGPNRGHWGMKPTGFLQNSIVYSLGDDFTFDSTWGHRMLGFPNFKKGGVSKGGLKSLAGESVDLWCEGVIFYALFLIEKAPWWSRSEVDLDAEETVNSIARPLRRRRLPPSFRSGDGAAVIPFDVD